MNKGCVTSLQEQIRTIQEQRDLIQEQRDLIQGQLDLVLEENKQLKKDNEQLVSTLEKADPPVILTKVEEDDDGKIPWGSGEVGWGRY